MVIVMGTLQLLVHGNQKVKLAYDYVLRKGERNITLYGVSLGATVIAKAVYDYGLSPSRIIFEYPL